MLGGGDQPTCEDAGAAATDEGGSVNPPGDDRYVRKGRFPLFLALVCILAAPLAAAGAWTMASPDATNTYAVPGPAAGNEPVFAWSVPKQNNLWMLPPVTADDLVVMPSGTNIVALDRSGTERWRQDLGSQINDSIALAPPSVLATTEDGTFWALDEEDGTVLVQQRLGDGYPTGAGAAHPWFFACIDRALNIWDSRDGEPAPIDLAPCTSMPTVAGGTIYFLDWNLLRAVDVASGAEQWEKQVGPTVFNPVATNVAYHNDRLYFVVNTPVEGEEGQYLYSLDAATGDTLWRQRVADTWYITDIAVGDPGVFVQTASGLRGYDDETGTRLWEASSTGDWKVSNPTLFGSTVLIWEHHLIRAFDSETGQELWSFDNWPHQIFTDRGAGTLVTDGRFLYGSKGSNLVALDFDREPPTPSPIDYPPNEPTDDADHTERTFLVAPGDPVIAYDLSGYPHGAELQLEVSSDGPIAVFLVDKPNLDRLFTGREFEYMAPPSRTDATAFVQSFHIPAGGPWYIAYIHDASMGSGTFESSDQTPRFVTSGLSLLADPFVGGSLVGAMLFHNDYWMMSEAVGITGLTLWQLLACGLVWPVFKRHRDKLLAWTAGAAGASFLASTVTSEGVLIVIGVPIAIGAAAGYAAAQTTGSFWDAIRFSYFVTFVGTLVGGDLLNLMVRISPSAGDLLVIGGAVFDDALWIAPAVAAAFVAGDLAWDRATDYLLSRGGVFLACPECDKLIKITGPVLKEFHNLPEPLVECLHCESAVRVENPKYDGPPMDSDGPAPSAAWQVGHPRADGALTYMVSCPRCGREFVDEPTTWKEVLATTDNQMVCDMCGQSFLAPEPAWG